MEVCSLRPEFDSHHELLDVRTNGLRYQNAGIEVHRANAPGVSRSAEGLASRDSIQQARDLCVRQFQVAWKEAPNWKHDCRRLPKTGGHSGGGYQGS